MCHDLDQCLIKLAYNSDFFPYKIIYLGFYLSDICVVALAVVLF